MIKFYNHQELVQGMEVQQINSKKFLLMLNKKEEVLFFIKMIQSLKKKIQGENCKLLKYLHISSNHEYTCKLDNLTKLEEITMLGLMVITGLQKCINLKKFKLSFNKSNQLEDKNMSGFRFLETIDLTSSVDEFKKGISNISSGVQKIGF